MAKIFYISTIVFLGISFAFLLLTSLSLPYLTAIDITRTTFAGRVSQDFLTEIRLGTWAACYYDNDDKKYCPSIGNGYDVKVQYLDTESLKDYDKLDDLDLNDLKDLYYTATVSKAWTRGLAIHPVAGGVTLVAFILSFFSSTFTIVLTSGAAALASALTLLAFAIDISLYVHTKNTFNQRGSSTHTGAAFWMTFVALIFLLLSTVLVWFGRRREKSSAGSYPMTSGSWWKKLQRGSGHV